MTSLTCVVDTLPIKDTQQRHGVRIIYECVVDIVMSNEFLTEYFQGFSLEFLLTRQMEFIVITSSI